MSQSKWNDLFEFAILDKIDEQLELLAKLAEPEEWSSKAAPEKPYHVLYQYIKYTFLRIAEEDKIVYDETTEYACFNTGLVTTLLEDIYALFRKNLKPEGPEWFFLNWVMEGSYDLDKFPALPRVAHYFDDPLPLIFDHRRDIRYNLAHIIQENRERFPEELRKQNDQMISILLKGAIERTKKLVKRNYKVAIPQWYNGTIQLLLPLCLIEPTKADLALVVQRTGQHYRASTILNLPYAYSNARLLVKPDREWLIP